MNFTLFPIILWGTNQDIDISRSQFLQNPAGILGGTGTTQIIDLAGQTFQTFLEGLKMLVGQYRGRHQHSDLLVVGYCLESGPEWLLPSSETDITADQTVHRTVAFHVLLDLLGRLQLVGSILVEEAGLKFMLQKAVRTVAEAFFLLAQRIEFDEVAGNVLDFRLRPVLDFLPGTGAQLTDTGRFSFLAFVFRYFVQRVDGHKRPHHHSDKSA